MRASAIHGRLPVEELVTRVRAWRVHAAAAARAGLYGASIQRARARPSVVQASNGASGGEGVRPEEVQTELYRMMEDGYFVDVPVLEQLPVLLRGGTGAYVAWRGVFTCVIACVCACLCCVCVCVLVLVRAPV